MLFRSQAQLLQRLGVNTFVRLQPGIAALQGNAGFSGGASVGAHAQELSVARLNAFVLRSIERHTRWVFGSRRTPELVAALERQVSAFLSKLKQEGALAGATVEQSFFVRTSAPAALVAAEHDVALTLRIGFAPKRPNEFVTFDFRYHEIGRAHV